MNKQMKNFKVISWLNQMPEKGFVILLLLVTLLYNIVIGLSGLDVSDEGFLLSAYQQFFPHTESITSTFTLYNTLLIGAIWNSAFEAWGIIGFRILAALCITAIVAVVYFLCRDLISRWWIVIGLGIVVISRHYILVFHYNHTSALVALLLALFIYQSLTKNNTWYMFVAGIVLGLGALFRIPNICLCGLILALVPYYVHTSDMRMTMKLLCVAILGFVIGLVVNAALVFLLHHSEYFLSAMDYAFNSAQSANSNHNLHSMLVDYYDQIKDILTYFSILTLFFCIIYLIQRFENIVWVKWCLIGLSSLYIIYHVWDNARQEYTYLYVLYSICCIAFFWMFLLRGKFDIRYHYLATLAFLIMFLLPMGSNSYIINVGAYSLYLAMPLALGMLWNIIKPYSSIYKLIMMASLGIIGLFAAWGTMHICYGDNGCRLEKTAFVKEGDVPTTLTTPAKAEILDSLLKHIKPYKTAETELLAYHSIPLINYLTNTKPFVNNSWVELMTYEQFEKELRYGEQNKALPIIVLAKTPDFEWYIPNTSWKTVQDCGVCISSIREKNILLDDFIKRHPYSIEYEDGCFQVLIPKQN